MIFYSFPWSQQAGGRFVSFLDCAQASDVYKEEGETRCGPLEVRLQTAWEVTLMQTQKNSLLKRPASWVQSICERSLMSLKSITSMSMGIQWCRHTSQRSRLPKSNESGQFERFHVNVGVRDVLAR